MQLFQTAAVFFLYVKVSIPAQGFLSSDWFIVDVMLTQVNNAVKLASKMYTATRKLRPMLAEISYNTNDQSHVYIALQNENPM